MSRTGWGVALALLWPGLAASAAAGERARRDDPVGRRQAELLTEGLRGPEISEQLLRIAEQEALKYGLRGRGYDLPVRQAGSAWVNLGPSSADFAMNGPAINTLHKVDSGRIRSILVHPTDPNIVYVAEAGGGVWKTFNAKTAVTATTGPTWLPITEAIGSLSIGALAMNPSDPNSLLLGLGDPHAVKTTIGLLHSEDGGATWSTPFALAGVYPGSSTTFTSTSTRDLAFDRGGSGRALACTDAGLFRADNFGQGAAASWTLASPDTTGNLSQECWSLNQVGPGTWLMATVDSDGAGQLFRSTDNGTSWTTQTGALPAPASAPTGLSRGTLASTGRDTNAATARVYLLASNYDASYGRGMKQRDVFRSDDGGATWTSLGAYAGSGKAPTNPTTQGTQTDLDVIHDQADYNQAVAVDPLHPDTVFIGGNLSLLRSTDGGTTWSVMANWLPPAYGMSANMYGHADWHAAVITYDGGVGTFWGGNDGGLFKSSDVLTAAAPTGDNASASITWEDRLNRGLVSHLVYTVASPAERGDPSGSTCTAGAAEKEIVFGGLQDNGTRLRGNGTATSSGPNLPTTFNAVQGGDGFGVGLGCASGSSSMGTLLVSTYVTNLNYSEDGGATFTQSFDGSIGGITLDPGYNFVMVVATDHADPAGGTFLVPITDSSTRDGYLLYTDDLTQGWASVGATLKLAGATASGPWPNPTWSVQADNLRLGHWAVTTRALPGVNDAGSARVWVTVNGAAFSGGAAQAVWYGLPRIDLPKVNTRNEYLAAKSAALDPASATGDVVWAASGEPYTRVTPTGDANADNYWYKPVPAAQGRVFRTGNATASAKGTGTTTWVAQGADGSGLPNVPVNVIKVDPNDANTVYAGTEIGLYRGTYNGSSTTWTRYGVGLPLVSVTDLALAADGSSIRVSTYGRGFWEIQPKGGGSTAGVPGNGDFDKNQVIDGFDLVREAAVDKTSSADDGYDATGNLVGTTNAIDDADLSALVQKLGGRP